VDKKILQMTIPKKLLPLACLATLTTACTSDTPPANPPLQPPFAKGADISWITEMESAGKKFYTTEGEEMECTALMKTLGMNAIRLRVWVNPTNGWCSAADLLVKAQRAQALGMSIMVDFHYSDSWADPGKQNKPAAWASYSLDELQSAVAAHTTEVLNLLTANGINPAWVQVGNETGNGMLWETGKAETNMRSYALLHAAGYEAVRQACPNAKVVVHIHNGFDNNLFRWIFDGLKNNNAQWDVIGMSLYPSADDWQEKVQQCINNAQNLIARYGSEIMICEVGMPWSMPGTCKKFLTEIIAQTQALPDSKGLGVFYWEPECYASWSGYTLGAFSNNGQPTIALDAFRAE
jgi:arabinogalactan endo-1,4-beta-galactosidase